MEELIFPNFWWGLGWYLTLEWKIKNLGTPKPTTEQFHVTKSPKAINGNTTIIMNIIIIITAKLLLTKNSLIFLWFSFLLKEKGPGIAERAARLKWQWYCFSLEWKLCVMSHTSTCQLLQLILLLPEIPQDYGVHWVRVWLCHYPTPNLA